MSENLYTPTNREVFALVGSVICVMAGPVVLILAAAEPVNLWGVIAGVFLITLSWGLSQKSGMMSGKREGRLEERERKEKE